MKALEDAIKLADLWRAGKMIGGDPYDVCDALLTEVNRLTEVNAELLDALHMIKAIAGNPELVWKQANESISKAKEQQ